MYKEKKILAIIPARGGSKGLPKKNILPLAGKPLIVWTIEQAFASALLDKVVVSTDSEEIANICKENGLAVPFLRPKEYALDTSPSWEAIIHVINTLESVEETYDYILLLEPTSPLRKKNDIDDSIKLLIEKENDTLISVGEVHMEHPSICKVIDEKGYVLPFIQNTNKSIFQRQQLEKAYFPYGVVYMSSIAAYKKNKSFYTETTIPFVINRWQNYEVDDIFDFQCIESILKNNIGLLEK